MHCSAPHHFILYTLHHRDSCNQYSQKYRRIENSRNGYYHLCFEAVLQDGMKIFKSLDPLCWEPVGAQRHLVWQWFPETLNPTSGSGGRTLVWWFLLIKPSPTMNPGKTDPQAPKVERQWGTMWKTSLVRLTEPWEEKLGHWRRLHVWPPAFLLRIATA